MKSTILNHLSDVRNYLHEAGVLNENEDIVLVAGQCALLEKQSVDRVAYRAVNLFDLRSRYLYTRKNGFEAKDYPKIIGRMECLEINDRAEERICASNEERASKLLSHIFDSILPQHGLAKRKNQKELALAMLEALQKNKLALCEAEVGTGKTHAYILAVTVYNLFSEDHTPTVISTSTIALQEALVKDYIPQVSRILLEHRIINVPLSFVVRKGKSHYVCEMRLKTYESSIRNQNRPEDIRLLEQLEQLWGEQGNFLDLDRVPLTPYVKERINVTKCSDYCPHYAYCRYAINSRRWADSHYDFQVTNHNYVLADTLNRKEGRKRLLPCYNIVIFDEAHKLIDVARQIYCTSLTEYEIPKLIHMIAPEHFMNREIKNTMMNLCEELSEQNDRLFQSMAGDLIDSHNVEDVSRTVDEDVVMKNRMRTLVNLLEQLGHFWGPSVGGSYKRFLSVTQTGTLIADKLHVFLNGEHNISWVSKSNNGVLELCSVPKELNRMLYRDLWHAEIHSIITSGTISVGGDFSHFKRTTGIDFLYPQSRKVMELTKSSPFDYRENALLYIPERMPFPNIRDERYIRTISKEIIKLVYAAYGHTLILFSSYWLLERIFFEIQQDLLTFPLFLMKRGRMNVIEEFRKSGNGVLFASDSAGEGIDLPGDILSSVIIVKLPFPVPSPLLESERTKYENTTEYMEAVIIPGMIIKLRQWFGRGIRRETDTAVFSILDCRAGLHGRFRDYILNVLPPMQVTDRIKDVEQFLLDKKNDEYFRDKDR